MIDTTDLARFAATLESPIVAEPWQAEWSNKVADEMRANAPVDTGRLRDSIRVTGDGVEVGVDYGSYVEYGTARTAPRPFTAPAVNRLIRDSAEDLGYRVVRQLT